MLCLLVRGTADIRMLLRLNHARRQRAWIQQNVWKNRLVVGFQSDKVRRFPVLRFPALRVRRRPVADGRDCRGGPFGTAASWSPRRSMRATRGRRPAVSTRQSTVRPTPRRRTLAEVTVERNQSMNGDDAVTAQIGRLTDWPHACICRVDHRWRA